MAERQYLRRFPLLRTFSSPVIKFISLFLILMISPSVASVEEEKNKTFDTLTIYWENDAFAGTDGNYTNGFKFTWSTPYLIDQQGSVMSKWANPIFSRLPLVDDPGISRAVSLSVGQNIYTPEDTETEKLIEDQRPYAGYLYAAFGFHSRSKNRKDIWEIDVGMVGPASLAEQTQNLGHDIIGNERAQGWNNQLKNEPTIEIIYESKWRWLYSSIGRRFGYDVIPHLGGRLGNVPVYANTGFEIRFGWYLLKNFGTCPIRPGCETEQAFEGHRVTSFQRSQVGIHLFTAVDGRAVLHDIFLDGNTFQDSHSVKKNIS